MARKRTPCEWCDGERFFQLAESARNVQGGVEIYPDNGFMSFYVQGMDDDGALKAEDSMDIPLNFCPNCGRKLV